MEPRKFVNLALATILVAIVAGLASGAFLLSLDLVTTTRLHEPRLLFLLPLAGAFLGFTYDRLGSDIRAGTDLVVRTIRDGGARIPRRMAPMVALGTLLTHLFGGSAGREGTAVQMGASLADAIASRLRLDERARRLILIAGVAGGFGAVFGTPVAGALFAVEFLSVGAAELRSIGPALFAAFVGDATARSIGATHSAFPTIEGLALTPFVVARLLVLAFAIAAVIAAFLLLVETIRERAKAHLSSGAMRACVGGCAVVALALLLGTDRYLGLGVDSILEALRGESVRPYDFAAKALFTALTVGTGFIGGEVTPLFFVGATLGSALGGALGLPLSLCAGVGLAATFGAASKSPLALSIMAVELFGAAILPHVVLVTFTAAWLTGRRSLYAEHFRDALGSTEV